MTVVPRVAETVAEVRKEWGWFLALGIGLVALGVVSIVYEGIATLGSVVALGVFVILAGLMQLAAGFQARTAGHVILYLIFGVFDVLVGSLLIAHPVGGALLVTAVLAIYLMFGGVFRIIYALWSQLPNYGWAAFSGVLSVVLGAMLWEQWPSSAVWFLGFAVGLSFIFAGLSWIGLSLKLHSE